MFDVVPHCTLLLSTCCFLFSSKIFALLLASSLSHPLTLFYTLVPSIHPFTHSFIHSLIRLLIHSFQCYTFQYHNCFDYGPQMCIQACGFYLYWDANDAQSHHDNVTEYNFCASTFGQSIFNNNLTFKLGGCVCVIQFSKHFDFEWNVMGWSGWKQTFKHRKYIHYSNEMSN